MTECTKDGKKETKPIISIQYKKEMDEIKKSLNQTHASLNYRMNVATIETLGLCLNENPVALHFSGHGMENRARNARNNDFLVFEDNSCMAQYVSCNTLKNFFNETDATLEFVFVSSCHSALVGKVFKEAGANHVVCIQKKDQILDEAALKFAKAFYFALFNGVNSVCQAFAMAKRQIEAYGNLESEARKFVLLKGYNHVKEECNLLTKVKEGNIKRIDSLPPLGTKLPGKSDHFSGRSSDMMKIIHYCCENKLVTVRGIPGIGKSALVRRIANHLYERNFFEDGVIFASHNNEKEITDYCHNIVQQIYVQCEGAFRDFYVSQDAPWKTKLDRIIQRLKDYELLFILDNFDVARNKDEGNFKYIVRRLLDDIPKLRILMTSSYDNLTLLSEYTQQIYDVEGLDKNSSIKVFEKLCPRKIDEAEKVEFLAKTNNKGIEEDLCALSLEGNVLMSELKGHPKSIALAAELIAEKSLFEVYSLITSPDVDSLGLELSEREQFVLDTLMQNLSFNKKTVKKARKAKSNFNKAKLSARRFKLGNPMNKESLSSLESLDEADESLPRLSKISNGSMGTPKGQIQIKDAPVLKKLKVNSLIEEIKEDELFLPDYDAVVQMEEDLGKEKYIYQSPQNMKNNKVEVRERIDSFEIMDSFKMENEKHNVDSVGNTTTNSLDYTPNKHKQRPLHSMPNFFFPDNGSSQQTKPFTHTKISNLFHNILLIIFRYKSTQKGSTALR